MSHLSKDKYTEIMNDAMTTRAVCLRDPISRFISVYFNKVNFEIKYKQYILGLNRI